MPKNKKKSKYFLTMYLIRIRNFYNDFKFYSKLNVNKVSIYQF